MAYKVATLTGISWNTEWNANSDFIQHTQKRSDMTCVVYVSICYSIRKYVRYVMLHIVNSCSCNLQIIVQEKARYHIYESEIVGICRERIIRSERKREKIGSEREKRERR